MHCPSCENKEISPAPTKSRSVLPFGCQANKMIF